MTDPSKYLFWITSRAAGTTAIVTSGVASSMKPKPASRSGKRRYQAAPTGPDGSTATTPASPGRPQPRT